MPGNSFSVSPAFNIMGSIMREEYWGIVSIIIGLSLILAVRLDKIRVEIGLAFVAAFFWGFVTVPFALSSWSALGTPVYGLLCFYASDHCTKLLGNYLWRRKNGLV